MVIYEKKDTLTLDMHTMCVHTQAVSEGAKHALVVSDMPFLSYQTGIDKAVFNAGRLLKSVQRQ
jgi:3-methyl-2-oxobutanoate hydroxymethyltransferase